MYKELLGWMICMIDPSHSSLSFKIQDLISTPLLVELFLCIDNHNWFWTKLPSAGSRSRLHSGNQHRTSQVILRLPGLLTGCYLTEKVF